ncbi:conserved hypothetical protein [Ricinus communis]|uniref:Uncharacterized protein n=1 Tax=Ricinus communis TaxID=3988 RepID=B9S4V6_RICCO|nr:conserved hypothetical protein [Ricinus communis]
MQAHEAIRVPSGALNGKEEEREWKVEKVLGLETLQRGPVPSGASGCTNIPKTGEPPCVNQMNFAGRAAAVVRAPSHPHPHNITAPVTVSANPIIMVSLLSMQAHEAIRVPSQVLSGKHEERWKVENGLGLEALDRGPSPPGGTGSSGCTHVPKTGEPPCVSQMNFAGRAVAAVPPPPPCQSNLMAPIAVSANRK